MNTITIDRALVEQVLETIEGLTRDRLFTAEWAGKHGATIAALHTALAQQAEPVEPVATVVARQYDDGTYAGNALDWAGRGCENDFPIGTNFYTSPPQPPAPPANQP
jgi:hypothetical protein